MEISRNVPLPHSAGWDELECVFGVESHQGYCVRLAGMTRRHRRVLLDIWAAGPGIVGFRLMPFGADTRLMDWGRTRVVVGERGSAVTVEEDREHVRISGAEIPAITVDKRTFRLVLGQTETPLWETDRELGTLHEQAIAPQTGFYEADDAAGVTYARLQMALPADARLAGLGERFVASNLVGRTLAVWNEDADGVRTASAYKCIPFILSNQGWGILVNSPGWSSWDLGQTARLTMTVLEQGPVLEWYVVTGPSPKEIVGRYVGLTGLPEQVAAWATGVWISTGFLWRDAQDIRAIARKLREQNFPADVFHLDCWWQKPGTWSSLQWNDAAIPDARGLITDLRSQGFHVSVWEQPYVEEGSPGYVSAVQHDVVLKRFDRPTEPWLGVLWGDVDPVCRVAVVDFTHPEIQEWYRAHHRELLDWGVEVLKADFGEEIPANAVNYEGFSGSQMRNLFALDYIETVFKTVREVHPAGMVLARSGYSGMQRYPAAWPGDPHPTLDDLRLVVNGGLNAAASGIAFWAMDIAGFKDELEPDVYVRWAQAGLFAPLARFHRVSRPLPWDYGEEALSIVRETARLRYRFMPYIRALADEAHRTGVPMLRPLWMEFPDDADAWTADGQYLLGDALLVAPVFTRSGHVSFYLPPGDWYDWYAGQMLTGPCRITRIETLDRFPLLVRAGRMVPMFGGAPTSNQERQDRLELLFLQTIKADRRWIRSLESGPGSVAGSIAVEPEGARQYRITLDGQWPAERTIRIVHATEGVEWQLVMPTLQPFAVDLREPHDRLLTLSADTVVVEHR